MSSPKLTLAGVRARPVVLPLKRPVVARIVTITEWPLVLIDLVTEEGIIGRSYLEPYTIKTMRYLVPALHDFGEMLRGRPVAPFDLYDLARRSLHFVGYQGMSQIAVSGLDMAAWDALAKAAEMPLCVFLGGSMGWVRAYNSNGLWLRDPRAVAEEALELRDEGGFSGLKLRLGRERLREDLAALDAVRTAVGEDIALMVDFNQGLHLGEALERCHALDEFGLAWIEEPIVYDNFDGYAQLAAELKTPIQIGENFYGPRDLHRALQMKACNFVMSDFMRIGGVTGWLRAAAIAGSAGVPVSTHLYPEVAAHVMRVTETVHWLEWQDWADPILQKSYEMILIISESALGPIKQQSDRHARVAIFLLLDTEVYNGVAICGEVRSLRFARQAWVAAESDWRRGLLNHYRNRFVAHRAEPDHDKRVPFVDELETISGRVVFMLAQLATGAGIQVDNREVQSDTNYLSASAFWKPWQSGIRS